MLFFFIIFEAHPSVPVVRISCITTSFGTFDLRYVPLCAPHTQDSSPGIITDSESTLERDLKADANLNGLRLLDNVTDSDSLLGGLVEVVSDDQAHGG